MVSVFGMAMKSFVLITAAGLWLGTLSCLAADTPAAPPPDTLEQRMMACAMCHGKDGQGVRRNEFNPRIASKPADYIYNQLVNFRDGRRQYPEMAYLARYLPDAYMHEIAAYYAKLRPPIPAPIKTAMSPQAVARGEALVRKGDPAKGIPACENCHGKALTGMLPAIPGLVGLDSDYIIAQLGGWQTGSRRALEPDCMAKIATKLSGTDLAAVGAWLAAQPVPANMLPAPDKHQPLPLACGSQPR